MKLGNLQIEKTAALAPMAGVADRALRELCIEFGAALTVGEMASAKGICYNDSKTQELLFVSQAERPMAVQLFGTEPLILARAVETALKFSPDAIDINMGCPAPKIVSGGAGSALMKNLPLAGEIIRETVRASTVPVTVKMRRGWDENSVNAVELAKIVEQNGAAAVAVHGRTTAQMYMPSAELSTIKAVKEAVKIPVIGNGDIASVEDAVRMYEESGCDLVMIGRGALGRPWLFAQIRSYLQSGIIPPEPELPERMEIMLRHIRRMCEYKGEYIGMKEARKHSAWYFTGLRGAAGYRRAASALTTISELEVLAGRILSEAGGE